VGNLIFGKKEGRIERREIQRKEGLRINGTQADH
jgi:hypothetical protein